MIGALSLPSAGIYTSPAVGSGLIARDSAFETGQLTSNDAWVWSGDTFFASQFVGRTARLYVVYTNGNAGSSFQGDFGLDHIYLPDGAIDNTNTELSTWQYGSSSSASINNARNGSWTNVGVFSTSTGGRWNMKTGSTPSSSTGPSGAFSSSYYLYAETSSPTGFNENMWVRSPSFVISINKYSFYYHGFGACIGRVSSYVVIED